MTSSPHIVETLFWIAICLLVAPFGWFLWPFLFRATAGGEFQPSLVTRVQVILEPYAGTVLSAAALAELQGQVDTVVRDTLVDLHREFEGLVVSVRNDELGPACFIAVQNEPELELAEFAARLME